MFEWHIAELKLWEERKRNKSVRDFCFSCEYTTSREDKIDFIDKMEDGKLSYFLDLKEKFDKEKPNLPKDNWGNIKTVSLKAWLKKNDIRQIVDNRYNYGEVAICGLYVKIQSENSSGFWIYKDLVDEAFHRQLLECARLECEYFKTHDDYEMLKTLLKEKVNKHDTTFGVPLVISSDDIFVGEYDNNRSITVDEIKELLHKYEKLEAYIIEVTEDTHITK